MDGPRRGPVYGMVRRADQDIVDKGFAELSGFLSTPGIAQPRDASNPSCVARPGEKLLILLNPGAFTRHYLMDMASAAAHLGIPTATFEMGELWARSQTGHQPDPHAFANLLRRERVCAVLSSSHNGLFDWPVSLEADGRPRPFFEAAGIPHIMWWTDHPHWANERLALRADLQPVFRSPNNSYFVKSELAACELREVLGWPRCFGLPVAENPERLRPVPGVAPSFDVVAIVASPPSLDARLTQFVEQDDPDVDAIIAHLTVGVLRQLSALWGQHAPKELHTQLEALGRAWTGARAKDDKAACFRLFQGLEPEYPEAAAWLRANHQTYFEATYILWDFGRWQRTFILAYLARYFRVGIFGSDWSSLGMGGGKRIGHDEQPAVYSRGRIAINVSQAGDEEGISHKPFQIAASGVPMVHIDRKGLSDCFLPDVEVKTFSSPRQAREAVAALLDDPARREALATAARERLCRDHTWMQRLPQILSAARVYFPSVPGSQAQPALRHFP